MMTSKERAELRAQANTLDTILMVGKGGVSETLIAEAEKVLDARELVKGRVLESAMMSAREVCDAICEQTGAEGIQVVGNKFVIYRKSEKLERERKAQAQPKAPKPAKKKVNPVKAGIRSRRKAAKEERERGGAGGHRTQKAAEPRRVRTPPEVTEGTLWRRSEFTAEASIRRIWGISARRSRRAACWGWIV